MAGIGASTLNSLAGHPSPKDACILLIKITDIKPKYSEMSRR